MKKNISNMAVSKVSFASINQYVESNIILPTEKVLNGKEYVVWGDGNTYPNYLMSLYKASTTLKSVIDGCVDYIVGNDVVSNRSMLNTNGETPRELLKKIALDNELYGGFALQVIRNRMGEVAELYHIDLRHLRTNKKNNVFWWAEDWSKRGKAIKLPKYMQVDWQTLDDAGKELHSNSVLFVKNDHTQVYPLPLYGAESTIIACELEKKIGTYHINNINNGFVGSMVVNFNNGIPEDNIKDEIEREFNEKFCGAENGGRAMLSWNEDKEHSATIETPEVKDYNDRYQTLDAYCKEKIYSAFRANPNLFGIPTQNLGFNQEEYESSFKLFNRTMIQPAQRLIVEALSKLLGEGAVNIVPFSIENTNDNIVN
jgi:capsid portal protein